MIKSIVWLTLLFWLIPELSLAEATTLPASPVTVKGALNMILSLFLVLLVVFGLAWSARRFGAAGFNSKGILKIVDGLAVGTRERIVLLQVGDKHLLVGITQSEIRLLDTVELEMQEGAESIPVSNSFAEKLLAALKKQKR